jgi:hypothetical protein
MAINHWFRKIKKGGQNKSFFQELDSKILDGIANWIDTHNCQSNLS